MADETDFEYSTTPDATPPQGRATQGRPLRSRFQRDRATARPIDSDPEVEDRKLRKAILLRDEQGNRVDTDGGIVDFGGGAPAEIPGVTPSKRFDPDRSFHARFLENPYTRELFADEIEIQTREDAAWEKAERERQKAAEEERKRVAAAQAEMADDQLERERDRHNAMMKLEGARSGREYIDDPDRPGFLRPVLSDQEWQQKVRAEKEKKKLEDEQKRTTYLRSEVSGRQTAITDTKLPSGITTTDKNKFEEDRQQAISEWAKQKRLEYDKARKEKETIEGSGWFGSNINPKQKATDKAVKAEEEYQRLLKIISNPSTATESDLQEALSPELRQEQERIAAGRAQEERNAQLDLDANKWFMLERAHREGRATNEEVEEALKTGVVPDRFLQYKPGPDGSQPAPTAGPPQSSAIRPMGINYREDGSVDISDIVRERAEMSSFERTVDLEAHRQSAMADYAAIEESKTQQEELQKEFELEAQALQDYEQENAGKPGTIADLEARRADLIARREKLKEIQAKAQVQSEEIQARVNGYNEKVREMQAVGVAYSVSAHDQRRKKPVAKAVVDFVELGEKETFQAESERRLRAAEEKKKAVSAKWAGSMTAVGPGQPSIPEGFTKEMGAANEELAQAKFEAEFYASALEPLAAKRTKRVMVDGKAKGWVQTEPGPGLDNIQKLVIEEDALGDVLPKWPFKVQVIRDLDELRAQLVHSEAVDSPGARAMAAKARTEISYALRGEQSIYQRDIKIEPEQFDRVESAIEAVNAKIAQSLQKSGANRYVEALVAGKMGEDEAQEYYNEALVEAQSEHTEERQAVFDELAAMRDAAQQGGGDLNRVVALYQKAGVPLEAVEKPEKWVDEWLAENISDRPARSGDYVDALKEYRMNFGTQPYYNSVLVGKLFERAGMMAVREDAIRRQLVQYHFGSVAAPDSVTPLGTRHPNARPRDFDTEPLTLEQEQFIDQELAETLANSGSGWELAGNMPARFVASFLRGAGGVRGIFEQTHVVTQAAMGNRGLARDAQLPSEELAERAAFLGLLGGDAEQMDIFEGQPINLYQFQDLLEKQMTDERFSEEQRNRLAMELESVKVQLGTDIRNNVLADALRRWDETLISSLHNPKYDDRFWSNLASGAGSLAQFAVGGRAAASNVTKLKGLSRATGISKGAQIFNSARLTAARTTTAIMGSAMNASEGVAYAQEWLRNNPNISNDDIGLRDTLLVLAHSAAGLTEAAPIERALKKVDLGKVSPNAKNLLLNILIGGIIEGTQEGFMAAGNRVIQEAILADTTPEQALEGLLGEYDLSLKEFRESATGEDAKIGAVLGMIMEVFVSGAAYKKARRYASAATQARERAASASALQLEILNGADAPQLLVSFMDKGTAVPTEEEIQAGRDIVGSAEESVADVDKKIVLLEQQLELARNQHGWASEQAAAAENAVIDAMSSRGTYAAIQLADAVQGARETNQGIETARRDAQASKKQMEDHLAEAQAGPPQVPGAGLPASISQQQQASWVPVKMGQAKQAEKAYLEAQAAEVRYRQASAAAKIAQGRIDSLTEAERQSLEGASFESTLGNEAVVVKPATSDVAGVTVVTDETRGWMQKNAPSAARLVRMSEAETTQRANEGTLGVMPTPDVAPELTQEGQAERQQKQIDQAKRQKELRETKIDPEVARLPRFNPQGLAEGPKAPNAIGGAILPKMHPAERKLRGTGPMSVRNAAKLTEKTAANLTYEERQAIGQAALEVAAMAIRSAGASFTTLEIDPKSQLGVVSETGQIVTNPEVLAQIAINSVARGYSVEKALAEIQQMIKHEQAHVGIARVASEKELADIWKRLPEATRQKVLMTYYNNLYDKAAKRLKLDPAEVTERDLDPNDPAVRKMFEQATDAYMAQEYFRMLVQAARDGVIDESIAPPRHLLQKILDILERLVEWLNKDLKAMKRRDPELYEMVIKVRDGAIAAMEQLEDMGVEALMNPSLGQTRQKLQSTGDRSWKTPRDRIALAEEEGIVRMVASRFRNTEVFPGDLLDAARQGVLEASQKDLPPDQWIKFAITSANNQVLMLLRSIRRNDLPYGSVRSLNQFEGTLEERLASAQLTPYENVAREEGERLLNEAIAELPTKQRQVAEMILAGATQTDIAREMGISQPAVSKILAAAGEKLRSMLDRADMIRSSRENQHRVADSDMDVPPDLLDLQESATRSLEDFSDPDTNYRVVRGDESFRDIVDSGMIRTNASNKVQEGASMAERLAARPTKHPSFSKGGVDTSYAQGDDNHYIIESTDPSIQPSKQGRHGKGTTHFPTNAEGKATSLPGEAARVYKHEGGGRYRLVYDRGQVVPAAIQESATRDPDWIEPTGSGLTALRAQWGDPGNSLVWKEGPEGAEVQLLTREAEGITGGEILAWLRARVPAELPITVKNVMSSTEGFWSKAQDRGLITGYELGAEAFPGKQRKIQESALKGEMDELRDHWRDSHPATKDPDQNGAPIGWYRGHFERDGDIFRSRSRIHGFLGGGEAIYFTDNIHDASRNYADPLSYERESLISDIAINLRNEIESSELEYITVEGEYYTSYDLEQMSWIDSDNLLRSAATELLGSGAQIAPVYLHMKNPAVLDPQSDQQWIVERAPSPDEDIDLAIEQMKEDYLEAFDNSGAEDIDFEDWLREEYPEEVAAKAEEISMEFGRETFQGNIAQFIDGMIDFLQNGDPDIFFQISPLPDVAVEQLQEAKEDLADYGPMRLDDLLVKLFGDHYMPHNPFAGIFGRGGPQPAIAAVDIPGELVRQGLAAAGYDGIIMDASHYFPTMPAVEDTRTRHAIAWNVDNVYGMFGGLARKRKDPLQWTSSRLEQWEEVDPEVSNATKPLIELMVSNIYEQDMGGVVVREMLQNSLDAIRPALNAGESASDHRIQLILDRENRTLEMTDTGHGMLPRVVQTALINVTESFKQTAGSGGYGIAKAAIFGTSEDFTVETVARERDGSLTKTTMTGNGDAWSATVDNDPDRSKWVKIQVERNLDSSNAGKEPVAQMINYEGKIVIPGFDGDIGLMRDKEGWLKVIGGTNGAPSAVPGLWGRSEGDLRQKQLELLNDHQNYKREGDTRRADIIDYLFESEYGNGASAIYEKLNDDNQASRPLSEHARSWWGSSPYDPMGRVIDFNTALFVESELPYLLKRTPYADRIHMGRANLARLDQSERDLIVYKGATEVADGMKWHTWEVQARGAQRSVEISGWDLDDAASYLPVAAWELKNRVTENDPGWSLVETFTREASLPDVRTAVRAANSPTYTRIRSKISEDVDFDWWEAERVASKAGEYDLHGITYDTTNVSEKNWDEIDQGQLPQLSTAEHKDLVPITGYETDRGNYKAYSSPTAKSGRASIPIFVLNRGLYQFNYDLKLESKDLQMPEYVVIDVDPKFHPVDKKYPFTLNRDNLIEAERKELANYVTNKYVEEARRAKNDLMRARWANAPVLTTLGNGAKSQDLKVLDLNGNNEGVAKELAAHPGSQRMSRVLHRAAQEIMARLADTGWADAERGYFLGFNIGQKSTYGVNASTKHHLGQGDRDRAFFVDPVNTQREVVKDSPESRGLTQYRDLPERMAASLWTTIAHEINHNDGSGDWSDTFSYNLTDHFPRLAPMINDHINWLGTELRKIYEETDLETFLDGLYDAQDVAGENVFKELIADSGIGRAGRLGQPRPANDQVAPSQRLEEREGSDQGRGARLGPARIVPPDLRGYQESASRLTSDRADPVNLEQALTLVGYHETAMQRQGVELRYVDGDRPVALLYQGNFVQSFRTLGQATKTAVAFAAGIDLENGQLVKKLGDERLFKVASAGSARVDLTPIGADESTESVEAFSDEVYRVQIQETSSRREIEQAAEEYVSSRNIPARSIAGKFDMAREAYRKYTRLRERWERATQKPAAERNRQEKTLARLGAGELYDSPLLKLTDEERDMIRSKGLLAIYKDQGLIQQPAYDPALKPWGKESRYDWEKGLSDEQRDEMAEALAYEAMQALTQDGNALGWYDRTMKRAIREAKKVFPELSNKRDQAIFKAILAITSNGQVVKDQFKYAYEVFDAWLASDRKTLPTNGNWGGERTEAINGHFGLLADIIEKWGLAGAQKFLDGYYEVGTINKFGKKTWDIRSEPTDKNPEGKPKNLIGGELSDAIVQGSMIFGPKLGNFYANMSGDFSAVTMDRWFMRTFGRIRGDLVSLEENDKMIAAEERLRKVAKKNGLFPPADKAEFDAWVARQVRLNDKRYVEAREKNLPAPKSTPLSKALKNYLTTSGLKDAPKGGGERREIRRVMRLVQAKLRKSGILLNNADLQAVLWYYEKDLVEAFGGPKRGEAADYAVAATQLAGTFQRSSKYLRPGRGFIPAGARQEILSLEIAPERLEGRTIELGMPLEGEPLPPELERSEIDVQESASRMEEFRSNSSALSAIIRESLDGFTVDPTGNFAEVGYITAPRKETERFIDSNFTDQDLEDYFTEHAAMFNLPGSQLGGWYDKETDRFVLDVTFPIVELQTALDLAISADQDAIFDVSTFTEIRTKKDGKPIIPATASGWRQLDPSLLAELASEASWGVRQGLGEESSAILARRDENPSSPAAVRNAIDRSEDLLLRRDASSDTRTSEADRGGRRLLTELPPGLRRDADAQGNEHNVWLDHSLQRVWKLTKRDGSFGISDDAREYLQRWEGQNHFWGDDVRVEGFMPDGRVLISQPFVGGDKPTTLDLHKRLRKLGWEMVGTSGNVWKSENDQVVIKDAHNGNFVIDNDGKLRAIDVNMMSMDEFQQYEDDEWVEPDNRLSDIIEKNLVPITDDKTPGMIGEVVDQAQLDFEAQVMRDMGYQESSDRSIPLDMEAKYMGAPNRRHEGPGLWMLPNSDVIPVPGPGVYSEYGGTHQDVAEEAFPDLPRGLAFAEAYKKGWVRINLLPDVEVVIYSAAKINRKQRQAIDDWAVFNGYTVNPDVNPTLAGEDFRSFADIEADNAARGVQESSDRSTPDRERLSQNGGYADIEIVPAESAANAVSDAVTDYDWDDYSQAAKEGRLAQELMSIGPGEKVVRVAEIFVDKDKRGQGIGSAILARAEDRGRQKGAVASVAFAGNLDETSSLEFWKKNGYRVAYDTPYQDAVVVKDLQESSSRLAEGPAYRDGDLAYDRVADRFGQNFADDAEVEEVMGGLDGLAPEERNFYRALDRDDWLGFDYPSQAIDAILTEPDNFELSPGTKSALGRYVNSIMGGDLQGGMFQIPVKMGSVLESVINATAEIAEIETDVSDQVMDDDANRRVQEASDRLEDYDYTEEQMFEALPSNKRDKLGGARDLERGTIVTARLDIPSVKKGVFNQTIHKGMIGPVLGYDKAVRLENVTMSVREKEAVKIKEGANKSPMAAVKGGFVPGTEVPADIQEWTALRFNPHVHAYFFTEEGEIPVVSADEAFVVGARVYVRGNIEIAPVEDFQYSGDRILDPDEEPFLTGDPEKDAENILGQFDDHQEFASFVDALRERYGEEEGSFTKGVPRLANPGEDAQTRSAISVAQYVYDQERKREKLDDWARAGEDLADRDPEGVKREILAAAWQKRGLGGPEMTIAAKIVTARAMRDATRSGNQEEMRQAVALAKARQMTRSEVAREMAAGRDTRRSPEERHAEMIADFLVLPETSRARQKRVGVELDRLRDQARVRELHKAISEAKSPEEANRARGELERLQDALDAAKRDAETQQKRIEKLERTLQNFGVTLRDIFDNKAVKEAKKDPAVEKALATFQGKERKIAEMLLKRMPSKRIQKQQKVSRETVEKVYADLRQALADKYQPSGQQMAARDDASTDASAFVDALLPPLEVIDRNRWAGNDFDMADPAQAGFIARVVSTVMSGGVSNAIHEIWINSILSGPQTQSINIFSNAISLGYDGSVQRGVESLVNILLPAIGRQKGTRGEAAQFGDIPRLWRGFLRGLAPGLENARKAWSTEMDFFESQALASPAERTFDEGKVESHQPAIPDRVFGIGTPGGRDIASAAIMALLGKGGRGVSVGQTVRIPGRALGFADSFFKTVIGHGEVAVQAYRIAKAEVKAGQLKAEQMEDRIAELMQYGSVAWEFAVEKAKELTFTDSFDPEKGDLDKLMFHVQRLKSGKANASESALMKLLVSFFFPFLRTPTRIFQMGLRKTPLGTINLLVKMGKAGIANFNEDGKVTTNSLYGQRGRPELVRDLAEQIIAWGVFAFLWDISEGDDDDEEKQLLVIGSRPYMQGEHGQRKLADRIYGGSTIIRIGGRDGVHLDYGRYEPISTVLTTVVDLIRAAKSHQKHEDKTRTLGELWGYFANHIQEKTFLAGIDKLNTSWEMSKTQSGRERLLTEGPVNFLRGFVPNLFRQPARNLDELPREYNSGNLYKLTGLGRYGIQKIDLYGRPVEKTLQDVPEPLRGITRLLVRTPFETGDLHPGDQFMSRIVAFHPELADKLPTTYGGGLTNKYKGLDGDWTDMTATELAAYRKMAGEIFSDKVMAWEDGIKGSGSFDEAEKDLKDFGRLLTAARNEAKEILFPNGIFIGN